MWLVLIQTFMNGIPTSRHHIRLNVLILMWRLFLVLFVLNTLYGLLLLLVSQGTVFERYSQELLNATWIGHMVLFVIQVIVVIYLSASWMRTNYYLTEAEVILASGIFTERETMYKLSDVRSVVLRQSWFGRVFNFGTIVAHISASGGYHEILKLKDIKDPKKYEHALRAGMQRPESE